MQSLHVSRRTGAQRCLSIVRASRAVTWIVRVCGGMDETGGRSEVAGMTKSSLPHGPAVTPAARYVLVQDGAVRSSENHQRSRWVPERFGRPGGGDQPAGFGGSNRYFGEIAVTPQLGPTQPYWPWVYSVDGEDNADKTLGELWGRSWYAYRYVGSTQGGWGRSRLWGMTLLFADANCTSGVSWAAPPRWRR